MTEVKTAGGRVLFSFDKSKTTLSKQIGGYKNLEDADLACADLTGADLRGANLKYADLRWANLKGADLRGANLENANIWGANLKGANLESADLSFSNLQSANLMGANIRFSNVIRTNLIKANLKDADISYAKLLSADLSFSNLSGAKLKCAKLKDANFRWANLSDADLMGADLWGANLKDAENLPDIPLACPSDGSFIAWKKVKGQYLIKLEIPEDARRSSATGNKCRCDKALVLDIENLENGEHPKVVENWNYCECVYEVGKMVYPDWFDEDRWNECSHGIHFFMKKIDAIDYYII